MPEPLPRVNTTVSRLTEDVPAMAAVVEGTAAVVGLTGLTSPDLTTHDTLIVDLPGVCL